MSATDWATKAAEEIAALWPEQYGRDGEDTTDELRVDIARRIASIIAAHAEPLVALLKSRRMHYHRDGTPRGDYAPGELCCPMCACQSWIGDERIPTDSDEYPPNFPLRSCDCGLDAYNARVEAMLAERGPSETPTEAGR